MSEKNFETNNNKSESSQHKSIIHQFEHGERLKAEREEKERQKALFAKKMAKFGEGATDNPPQSNGDVNQKAKMFVEIANKDPQQERDERERKSEFEKKKLGFQAGSVPSNDTKDLGGAEVLKKKQFFTGEADALDEEGQKKKQEEEELKEQKKKEFKEKSSMFNQSGE